LKIFFKYCQDFRSLPRVLYRQQVPIGQVPVLENLIIYFVSEQKRYVHVTGESLVIPLKCQCLTTVLLTVGLSHTSILASYFFTATSNNTVPEVVLYSYLAIFSNLTGFLWYFMCAALRCAAVSLEESLFKARHDMTPLFLSTYALF
jgi:hypothetical protein